jgi:serine/threonine protein kinase
MPLTPGFRIGVCEVIDLIAIGGMGEVYRARDTRLGRDVAIKSLPGIAIGEGRTLRDERDRGSIAVRRVIHIGTQISIGPLISALGLVARHDDRSSFLHQELKRHTEKLETRETIVAAHRLASCAKTTPVFPNPIGRQLRHCGCARITHSA